MKQAIYLMFLVTLILSFRTEAGASNRGADSLAFRIHLDKTDYLRGEVVWLHLFVINLTGDTLHTVIPDYDAFNTVDVHVVDNFGHELSNTIGVHTPRRICQQDLLLPHDTLLRILDMSYSFDQRTPTGDMTIVGQLPGSFTVNAVYLDRLTSNTVRYSVEEPQGSEAEAFGLYRAVIEAARSRKWGELISNGEHLLQIFPQSVYAPQVLDQMSRAYNHGEVYDAQETVACFKRLISAYPNSAWCQSAFGEIHARQTLEENRAYFQSIVNSKSGTWAAQVAGNLLTRPWLERSSKGGLKRPFK